MLKPAKIPSAGIAQGKQLSPKPRVFQASIISVQRVPVLIPGAYHRRYLSIPLLNKLSLEVQMTGVLRSGQGRKVEASSGSGVFLVCVWMGLCSSTWFHPWGVYPIDHLLSVGIWGYNEFLLGAARRQTQQIS